MAERSGRRSVLPSALIGIVVLIVLVVIFGPRLFMGWLENKLTTTMLDHRLLATTLGPVDAARPYRLATDTLTTPEEAGIALHRLVWSPGDDGAAAARGDQRGPAPHRRRRRADRHHARR